MKCIIKHHRLSTLVTFLSLLFVSGPASAVTISVFSNDLAGWTAAAGTPVITEDFSDAVLVSGLTITFGSGFPGSITGGVWRDQAFVGQAVDPVIQFGGAGVLAFGADWDLAGLGGSGTGIRFELTLGGGGTVTLSSEIPNTFTGQFWGIVSDVPIISARLIGGTQACCVESFDADNLRFVTSGAPVTVPEPMSIQLLGLGLTAIGLARWKRRLPCKPR